MPGKKVTTIVEDEVVFMVDPKAEFVSLVRHAANRTPFAILKAEHGGKDMASKVLQAVLVPNGVSEEVAAKHLQGCRTDEVETYDTMKKYVQVGEDQVEKDAQVAVLDEENKVYGVFATLKADSDKQDDQDQKADSGESTEQVVEKDALDWATLDDLYMELYAMADIIGGSLRQGAADPDERLGTILKAIDNFRIMAEALLSIASGEETVKAENHPDLVTQIINKEAISVKVYTCDCGAELSLKSKSDEISCPGCGAAMTIKEEAAPEEEVKDDETVKDGEETPADGEEAKDEETPDEETPKSDDAKSDGPAVPATVEELVDGVANVISDQIKKALDPLTERMDKLEESAKSVKDDVDKMKNTPHDRKSESDEDVPAKKQEDEVQSVAKSGRYATLS